MHYEEKLKITERERDQQERDITKTIVVEKDIKQNILSINREIRLLQRAIIEKHNNRSISSKFKQIKIN